MAAATNRTRERRLLPVWLAGAAIVVCLFAPQAQASTSLFTDTGAICTQVVGSRCWQAGDFGVLVGQYNAVTTAWTAVTANYSGAADINGEIGVGSGSKLTATSLSNTTWDGPIDFADALSSSSGTCGAGSCAVASGTVLQTSSPSRKTTVSGGTAQETSEIQTAMDQMRRISAYWSSQTGTAVTNFGAGTSSFSGTGTNVYDISAGTLVNTTSGTDITITGDSTSLFIFNIRSTSSSSTIPVRFNSNINLSGITADQVFFNIVGAATGSANYVFQATTSGKTLNGVFYVANDTYNVNTTFGGTAAGQGARLFGGTGSVTWGASFVLNDPNDVSPTPEPSTYVLLATGLGAILYARRRRRA